MTLLEWVTRPSQMIVLGALLGLVIAIVVMWRR